MTYLRAVLMWAVLAVIMTLNGMIRELALRPQLGFIGSQIVSSAIAIAVIFAAAYLLTRKNPDAPQQSWRRVGILWGCLTLAFEIGFGRWVAGIPWDVMLRNYNLLGWRLWPLVLLAVFAAPSLAARYLSERPRTTRR